MKLLHAVVRFCGAHARDLSGRDVISVPHDFRVTVPAPLAESHVVNAGARTRRQVFVVDAANQSRSPVLVLVAPQQ